MAPWFLVILSCNLFSRSHKKSQNNRWWFFGRFLRSTIQSIKIALLCGGTFDSFVVPATNLNKQLKKYQVPTWCANSCQARPGALSHCYSWLTWTKGMGQSLVKNPALLNLSAWHVVQQTFLQRRSKESWLFFRLSSSCWSCLASSNCCCYSWDLLCCDPGGDCWIRVW